MIFCGKREELIILTCMVVFLENSGGESAIPLLEDVGVFTELSSLPARSSRVVEPVGVVDGDITGLLLLPVTPGKFLNMARMESADAVFLPPPARLGPAITPHNNCCAPLVDSSPRNEGQSNSLVFKKEKKIK